MERVSEPVPGTFYRHFKHKWYQIVTVATHSETGERLVVYQALYGDYAVYARPLAMFMSPVDREKYPDADQEYRFEQAERPYEDEQAVGEVKVQRTGASASISSSGETAAPGLRGGSAPAPQPEQAPWDGKSPNLERFLDADTVNEQLAVLVSLRTKFTRAELDCICFALDIHPSPEKENWEQVDDIMQTLQLRQRYDGSRLRRRPWEEEEW